MPVSPRRVTNSQPSLLRPYDFHGADLVVRGAEAVGDCPFCGRDGKFYVEVDTTKYHCKVCDSSGNALQFVRALHAVSVATTPPPVLAQIAQDRRLLSGDTVAAWGACVGPGASWLVPGYLPAAEGGRPPRLDQLYRRTRVREGGEWTWRLLPTPGIWPEGKAHALHIPAADFLPARPRIDVCEGIWDGMAMWEAARLTGCAELADSNVVAVPGCGVWRDEWTEMCRGKQVVLWFDSDHPRVHVGRETRAGYDGMRRVAQRLSGVASSVRYVRWGPDGYNPAKLDGYDVRDFLSGV